MNVKALTLAALVGLAGNGMMAGAEAAVVVAARPAIDRGSPLLQKTQFYYSGREYCWYPGGWRGPGYYWCGYAYRRGLGWGGGYGWNGWGRGEGRREGFYRGGPRYYDRGRR